MVDSPRQTCPKHPDTAMRWISAGVSKRTGKPYNGFYACDVCRPPVRGGSSPANPLTQRVETLEQKVQSIIESLEE